MKILINRCFIRPMIEAPVSTTRTKCYLNLNITIVHFDVEEKNPNTPVGNRTPTLQLEAPHLTDL
jgi:hypothetical protein